MLGHCPSLVESDPSSALMISCSDLFKPVSGLLKSQVYKPSPSPLGLIFYGSAIHPAVMVSLCHGTMLLGVSPLYFSFTGHLVLFIVH